MTRKLVAILALDVVGYSRLMSEDETGTLARLTNLLSQVVEPAITKHQGRIVKTMGDGLLAEFNSAVEAVGAAVRIQEVMAAESGSDQGEAPFALRIGINLGDVITRDDDLYGQGVNVAARLESLAQPGEILVSSGIHEQVQHKLDTSFDDLGPHGLKNIPYPVHVFRARTQGTASASRSARTRRAGSRQWMPWGWAVAVVALVVPGLWLLWPGGESTVESTAPATVPAGIVANPSILVLPFDDLSEQRDQAYFVDGITEDIITDLAHFSGLKVLAQTTSNRFKGQPVDPQQIGRELHVTHLLEGSVRRAGDQLRITAQLVDTGSGQHLWAQRYDKQLVDVFAVQDEVRQNIIAALALELTDQEKRDLEAVTRHDVGAYDLLLRGLAAMNTETAETNLQAQGLFREAIAAEPGYGRGHGALAVALALAVNRGWADRDGDQLDLALEHAVRAVELDSGTPQVHWAMGYVQMTRREYTEAVTAIERAVSIAPSYAAGYSLMALIETMQGHGARALGLIEKAMTLNPYYSWDYLLSQGRALYLLEDYERAAAVLQEALVRNENARNPRVILAATYSALDRLDDAAWEIDQLTMQFDNITMTAIAETNPVGDPVISERFHAHLRKAGVPE